MSKQPLDRAPVAPASNRFVIAALGASAGGLAALEDFFDRMPADAGIAFIVVQHLSPDHASALGELLARCTAMPVEQAEDKTKIMPDCVYVIPPNATLTIQDHILRVAPPVEARGRRTPIDSLFCSLAEAHGEDAVCIMLSGTGTDGTRGLRAVKEHGGMAMAQNLESAKYDAMLRSAIATGLVDHVLPVKDMPAKLMDYAAHLSSLNGQANSIPQQIAKYSTKIHTVLRHRVGHDFSQYKEGTITRRLERRMKALQIDTVDQYVRILDEQPEEANLLFKDLLIEVTEFFRDPQAFDALSREVIPRLFANRTEGNAIRVCVVGCATGEEAYSIAILLREHASTLLNPPQIKIFATDIDERSLEVARKGCYPADIAEHVNAERLERFFARQDGTFQINRDLREMCLFSNHSFIKDPPFSRLDFISCRNVMIYLGDSLQRKVIPLFHYALRSGGYLFLGLSESVNSQGELFRPIDKKYRIFQRKDSPPRAAVGFPLGELDRAKRSGGKQLYGDEQSLPKRLERIILNRYAPACVIVNENGDAVYFSGGIGRYLEQPTGSPDTNVVNMAREGLRIPLRAALHRAATTQERAIQKEVSVQTAGGVSRVDLLVEALTEVKDAALFMVVIAESSKENDKQAVDGPAIDPSSEEIIRHLEGQLQSAREHAQAMFEELESSNEELSSANEEYQSANEELETSKEELQSFNEELETVNSELSRKLAELDTANSDLQNLLNGTQIATIFLDTELRIRNFTPAAGAMFHLLTSDFGRPLTDLAAQFTAVDLGQEAKEVLATLSLRERQVTGTDGRYYQQRILPYRTVNNVIAGVVLTFVDVTPLRRAEQLAQQARAYAESIVDTVREPLIVLDADMRVISASKAFYDCFQVSPEETVAKSLFELGNRQWDIPQLRDLLADVLPKSQKIGDYEVDHEFPSLGRRIMLLNARRLEAGGEKNSLLLLAIEDITDRKLAQDALRESERRNREIIEALPETVYTTDAEGRLTMFNQAAVTFSGRIPQLGGDSWCVTWKLYTPDGKPLPHDQSPMAATLREDRPVRGEEGIVERPDGTRRHFLAYPTPLHDSSGKLAGAVNMLVDITERKEMEEKLRSSEEQLRTLFEQTSSGIAQTDLTGRFLMVNEGYCRIVGRSSAELMNLRMQEITHPDDLPGTVEKFAALADGRVSNFTIEERYLRPDGSFVWVQNQVSSIHDDQGAIRYMAAAVTDITERKRADETRAVLVAVVDSSADAIISKDLNGVIRSWNAGAERLFGYTAEEAIGRPITILIPSDHADEEPNILERIRRGERIEHYETIRRRKDGTMVDISLTVSPIRDEHGQVVGASKIARDITDRKRMEQERRNMEEREHAMAVTAAVREMESELARVSRALTIGELTTSIAHEVNQPLAGIVTNAEACLRWLSAKTPNLHEARESLGLIVRDGNRASEVIRSIRELLKKDTPQATRLDINEVIQEALVLTSAELRKDEVAVRIELFPELPQVWADRIQLQQVILNLVINGREAMASVTDRARELVLSSQKWENNGVLVAVRDSGAGMNPEKIDRMFDAFFTTKQTGMGLGLSISRSLIEAHGGKIWATPNEGPGMTVQFTLTGGSDNL